MVQYNQTQSSEDAVWNMLEGRSIPSWKFTYELPEGSGNHISHNPGFGYVGTVAEMPTQRQASDYNTKELKFYKNGDPIMEIVLTLDTDERLDPEDDGQRRWYMNGQARRALQDEMKRLGLKRFGIGTRIQVTIAGFKPNPGGRATTLFDIKLAPTEYVAPEQMAVEQTILGNPAAGYPQYQQQQAQQLQQGFQQVQAQAFQAQAPQQAFPQQVQQAQPQQQAFQQAFQAQAPQQAFQQPNLAPNPQLAPPQQQQWAPEVPPQQALSAQGVVYGGASDMRAALDAQHGTGPAQVQQMPQLSAEEASRMQAFQQSGQQSQQPQMVQQPQSVPQPQAAAPGGIVVLEEHLGQVQMLQTSGNMDRMTALMAVAETTAPGNAAFLQALSAAVPA